MNYAAHVTAGAAAGIGISYASLRFHYNLSPVLVTVPCFLAAALPDIDHPKSHLGRRFRFLSKTLFKAFGHRTFTHSLLFCFLMGYLFMQLHTSVGIGVFCGILSHILLDMLTPFSKGVALLYPIKKRFGIFMS
ncbi:metal-dependent hydrolase [[Clostridium] polysaccharolyticum]|uniref:Inner membrane protein n=1 Tax=[Clostridium] polysaccharolyticum TaxID=29364 RepID=A0A1I0B3I2_9FIRM|nr:metal-dependent hydrolase [[Clostridium] polysaccharolyticum]SET01314.1 inner membrane protein [[Clostridium] polysaccharolyticum]